LPSQASHHQAEYGDIVPRITAARQVLSKRFHDLRHSAATRLLSTGVHPKVVQKLLGHSAICMTMDTYSHVLPSMHQEAMEKMDETFRQK
jgi:integrase